MLKKYQHWLPEIGLSALALFFTFRELGTFPGSWIDEGLFIMVAKSVASGHGYAIPLLDHVWKYPYFLAIGPTVILPTAASLKLFGLSSIAIARLPMTLYILGTCITLYWFTKKITDRSTARWAIALLVTLSAFVNTGKPVLGEVPAFFFLVLGLFTMISEKQTQRGIMSGIFFGLSVLTKLTYGLILPALSIAWIAAATRRQWKDVRSLTLSGCITLLVYLPWRWIEVIHTPAGSLTEELDKFVFGGGNLPVLNVLRDNAEILIRLPFLAFGIILLLGCTGLCSKDVRLPQPARMSIVSLVVFFTLYFLNSYGWYRHLLPAHLLLLPFVPVGVTMIVRVFTGRSKATRMLATGILTLIVCAQGLWQLQHRGSGSGIESAQAAIILQEQYSTTNLLIEAPELFAQLPDNAHWLYLIREGISPSMPDIFRTPNAKQRCFSRIRKLSIEEVRQYGAMAVRVSNYHLVPPPLDCP